MRHPSAFYSDSVSLISVCSIHGGGRWDSTDSLRVSVPTFSVDYTSNT